MATLKDAIQGKPVRCPLHPALVHFPIALFALGVALDVASWIFGRGEWQLVRGAFISHAVGVGTALLASIAGFVDYTDIRNDHPAKKTATLHMVLNLAALGLFAISVGLRYESLDVARTAPLPLFSALVAFGILGYSGYLGGGLVYNDGIGVGRHRRQTRTPTHTIKPMPKEAETEVMVADVGDLAEGETARVDLAGTIVTIACLDGRVHAFQEFCTHRYGPLSEGKLAHGQIECPWHGSRFNLETGKVCQGPAKLDLRTFPVSVRDGKIWLRLAAGAEPPLPRPE